MGEQEHRNLEYRRDQALDSQRELGLLRNDTGRVSQGDAGGNSGRYTKLVAGAVAAFLAIFSIFGFSVTFIPSIWLLIPAAILIGLGLRDLNRQKDTSLPVADNNKERELLSAIRDNGGNIAPAVAAIKTSLSVREADEMLSELANDGHLQIEGRDGVLYYSLPGRRTELES